MFLNVCFAVIQMVGTQGSDVNQAQSLEEVMAAEGLSFFERTCWGDLNERWRALVDESGNMVDMDSI